MLFDLEVSELQGCGALADNLSCVAQGRGGLLLAIRRDDLGPGLASCLGLGGHGPLQLHGQAAVLAK